MAQKVVKSLMKTNTTKDQQSSTDTLDLLLESLAFAYKEDATKPGVLVSKVNKNGKVYYASILRFSNGSKQRTVVVSSNGSSKDDAINKLAKKWIAMQKMD